MKKEILVADTIVAYDLMSARYHFHTHATLDDASILPFYPGEILISTALMMMQTEVGEYVYGRSLSWMFMDRKGGYI